MQDLKIHYGMITFGYNNKFSAVLRSLAAIGIGLVMVFSTEATINVVKIIAAFLFAAGVVSFFYGLAHRKDGAMGLMSVNAVVDILIGVLLFCFPGWVAGAIVIIIGVVLLIFGIIQILALAGTMSLLGFGLLSLLSLFFSGLAIFGGVVLIFNPFPEKVMSVMAGVLLIWYGISDLLSMRRVSRAKTEYEIHFGSKEEPEAAADIPEGLDDVKDAEYRKVDDQ